MTRKIPALTRLLQPQAKTATPTIPPLLRIQAKAEDPDVTEVMIYGVIGDSWFEESTTAVDFRRALAQISTSKIEMHINSVGGFVDEAIAIANAIRQHPASVTAVVDGLAASSASLIAVAADELVMSPNSELMIHDPEVLAIGNAAELEKTLARLQMVATNIASFYQAKGGGTVDEWRTLMQDETWYSAQEAVDSGLADRIGVTTVAPAGAEGGADPADVPIAGADTEDLAALQIFAYAGRANAPAPRILRPAAHHQPPAKPEELTRQEGTTMDLIQEIRNRLGIDPDAELDEAGVLAAIDEALEERAETGAVTNQLPEGVVAIDSVVLAQLQSDGAAGREARTQQINARREGVVAAAIADGKIPPARKDHWLQAIAQDEEGITATLAAMPKGLIPLDTIGYTGDGKPTAKADDSYPEAWKPSTRHANA